MAAMSGRTRLSPTWTKLRVSLSWWKNGVSDSTKASVTSLPSTQPRATICPAAAFLGSTGRLFPQPTAAMTSRTIRAIRSASLSAPEWILPARCRKQQALKPAKTGLVLYTRNYRTQEVEAAGVSAAYLGVVYSVVMAPGERISKFSG